MKCPFKKIVTVDTNIFGEKTTAVTFGDCDGLDCMACDVGVNPPDTKYIRGCKLIKEK